MSNIYKERQDYVRKPNRNNFDLSFTNNLTTKMAQMTPILCKETIPGDSFEIDFASGIRALPLVFPIQTPVTVEFEFYLVPYRILMDDWKDFIFNNKQKVHPYLALPYTRASEIGTGTLADYLGVPTTFAGNYGATFSLGLLGQAQQALQLSQSHNTGYQTEDTTVTPLEPLSIGSRVTTSNELIPSYLVPFVVPDLTIPFYSISYQGLNSFPTSYVGLMSKPFQYAIKDLTFNNMQNIADGSYNMHIKFYNSIQDTAGNPTVLNSQPLSVEYPVTLTVSNGIGVLDLSTIYDLQLQLLGQNGELRFFLYESNLNGLSVFLYDNTLITSDQSFIGSPCAASTDQAIIGDVPANLNPFVIQSGETKPAIPLSILPWRAYEAIYNRYKRNNIVNPLRINGEVEYNEYCTTKGAGADSVTPLNLRNRNYELDYLTSCYTSPQQGIAPLVGVTPSEDALKAVFHLKDQQTQQQYDVEVEADEDGELQGISTYTQGTPTESLLTIQDMIKYGISIQTFRSVNALNQWLSVNQRNGFRYPEQMFAHFGQQITNVELQAPIFVGGRTTRLSVTQINSTAKSEGMQVGDFAGQAYLADQSKHTIRFHSQEHGLVIGIMTICPIPSYSQLLPKLFLKSSPLDYYSEQFQHIGLQPITYKEVVPIQCFAAQDNLDDTFGYQRPYYDLIANVDEQHGRMRTDFQNFLITRTFGARPQLSQSFIECDPRNLTNPFVETSSDADNFICQIYFDIKAKRPVSRMAIERLEY